jgi:dihydrodipicolinate synthase/N-acetylneuraminate lyase
MKTSPVTPQDLAASVIAVPPLARDADLRLDPAANRALIRHLEDGGVRSLMYGGNANFYNLPLSEYADTLAFLAEAAGSDSWVVPSVGPDYGRMIDQARVLRDFDFPTVMVLPQTFPATPRGVETGLRRFAEAYGRPFVLYLKSEGYVTAEAAGRLAADGLICAVKYAVVRQDPAKDDYLRAILDRLDRDIVVSGIGERPAITHLRRFGLISFTSGSVCVAPRLSMRLLRALKAEDDAEAERLRALFLPLEDLRDGISPIRVLHDAVALAGIADTGPILPLLHNLDEEDRPRVAQAARDLLAADHGAT